MILPSYRYLSTILEHFCRTYLSSLWNICTVTPERMLKCMHLTPTDPTLHSSHADLLSLHSAACLSLFRLWYCIVAISSLSSSTFSFYTSTHVLPHLSPLSWIDMKQLLRLYSGACPCYFWMHSFFISFKKWFVLIGIELLCITMMVFDIYINMNQPHGYMCPSILNTTQTSLATPCFWVLPQHKSWMHLSCIALALGISFIYGNVPVSMLFSQTIPSLDSPLESQNQCYCLPKSHLYTLVNNICLSHSNFFFFYSE